MRSNTGPNPMWSLGLASQQNQHQLLSGLKMAERWSLLLSTLSSTLLSPPVCSWRKPLVLTQVSMRSSWKTHLDLPAPLWDYWFKVITFQSHWCEMNSPRSRQALTYCGIALSQYWPGICFFCIQTNQVPLMERSSSRRLQQTTSPSCGPHLLMRVGLWWHITLWKRGRPAGSCGLLSQRSWWTVLLTFLDSFRATSTFLESAESTSTALVMLWSLSQSLPRMHLVCKLSSFYFFF